MTERDRQAILDELDRLLNDPETRMDAHRVWALLAELRRAALAGAIAGAVGSGPLPA